MEPLVITIDGPSGAGKSTVSRRLASRLGYKYIDSGALYRIVALEVMQRRIDENNDNEIAQVCETLAVAFLNKNGKDIILCHGKDVSESIRTPEISMLASQISAKKVARHHLTLCQRNMGKEGNIVLEGRDAGTVVFPEAPVKFFLDATPAERGRRRCEELKQKGFEVSLEQITQEIIKRDHNDQTRHYAPLVPASDAVHIDSTAMTVEEVIETMMNVIKFKRLGGTRE